MNFSKKIFAFIKITRPINVAITFFVVVVAILISKNTELELSKIVLASLAASLVAAAGNIVNDFYDVETDKISHPNRILVMGIITKKEALFEYQFLNLIAVIISAYLSITLLIIVFISIVLLFFYSYLFKQKPLIGNIIIAFLAGMAFIYGGFVSGNPLDAIIPALFAFLVNLIREIVKDIQDIEGDSKLNYKTFPILFGITKSKHLIVIITILLILSTLYPFITRLYNIEYFIIIMIFVNPLLILCLKLLYDQKWISKLNTLSNFYKLNMIFGLAAIYFGK